MYIFTFYFVVLQCLLFVCVLLDYIFEFIKICEIQILIKIMVKKNYLELYQMKYVPIISIKTIYEFLLNFGKL